MKKLCVASAIMAMTTFSTTVAFADALTVKISNIESNKGTVRMAIIPVKNRADFPDSGRLQLKQPDGSMADGLETKAKIGSVVFTLDVPAGTYAIAAYHDVNGNQKVDKVPIVGLPMEPYGFSNDARGQFGPPSFGKSAFEVNGDTLVEFDVMK